MSKFKRIDDDAFICLSSCDAEKQNELSKEKQKRWVGLKPRAQQSLRADNDLLPSKGNDMPRKRARHRRGNGRWKPLTVDEACAIGKFSRRHFFRIKGQLETRKLGRRLLVNEPSVYRYIAGLPSC